MLTACGRAAVRPGMSQAQFLNQLKHERIVELSGEDGGGPTWPAGAT